MNERQLPKLPVGWHWLNFEELIEDLQPGFACGKRDTNGYYQLRMNNIGLDGKIVTDSLIKVPKKDTNLDKYRLVKGDVIFNNTNSPELVGKTALFNGELEECVYSNHLTRLRVRRELILPELITYFLRLEQKKGTFELLCKRFVGQAAVPKERLLRLGVPVPPISEQKRIIAKMQELFSLAEQAETSLLEAKKKLDDLDRMILLKGISGGLVRQDPKDEPVSLILEKLKVEEKIPKTKKTTLDLYY